MTDAPVSALRRRMIEDMTSRRLAPRTQEAYVRAVKNFTVFFGRSPDQANAEDLRRRHLHLASAGTTTPKMSAAVRRAALLLQRDAGTPGRHRAAAVCARAAQAASGVEPGGGGALPGSRAGAGEFPRTPGSPLLSYSAAMRD
jgi:hypothetical protein